MIAEIILLFLVVLILYCAAAWKIAVLMVKPLKSECASAPDEEGLPFETISFISGDLTLRGWFITKQNELNPQKSDVVILVHGWGGNASNMIPYAKIFFQSGYHVLAYNGRDHGNSDRTGFSSVYLAYKDLVSAIDFLQNTYGDNIGKTAVLGHSMGASCSILAMSYDDRIDAVISCSAFADPVDIVKRALKWRKIPPILFIRPIMKYYKWRNKTHAHYASPLNRIRHISAPILLVHGYDDRVIPFTDLEKLENNAPERLRTVKKLETIRHDNLLEYEGLPEIMVSFLHSSLNSNSGKKVK